MTASRRPVTAFRTHHRLLPAVLVAASIIFNGCATTPLEPYTEDTPPFVLVPVSQAGVIDKRGRFREIYCSILETRGQTLPDYRPCDEALTRVGIEPKAKGEDVKLGQSKRGLVAVIVPGIGWDCFANWLDLQQSTLDHVKQFGYDEIIMKVGGLSSSSSNAAQIRDAIMAMEFADAEPNIVLIGYSKGAPDILEAVVSYPEIRQHIAAVVSAAGTIGGSPLANDATQSQLGLLKNWPDAECVDGDGGAVESLRPAIRKAWLAANPLPPEIPYYSLVTYPQPERISSVLESSYNKLSRIDARNDSQVLFYDQIIPGSTLLGFVNADHWALAVPIARTHSTIGSLFVDQNSYPREALLEAVLRFIEEDLAKPAD
ncbi:MAG: hypothetical protein JSW45_09625 [Thiotrichales bacterium]|nr:MAG: hypothetical protein JSW45_09625 [Thiotrichales bacterium]